MKKLNKIKLISGVSLNERELIQLRGGYDYDPPCGYFCTLDTQCYFPCQRCSDVPGFPESKICTSP